MPEIAPNVLPVLVLNCGDISAFSIVLALCQAPKKTPENSQKLLQTLVLLPQINSVQTRGIVKTSGFTSGLCKDW